MHRTRPRPTAFATPDLPHPRSIPTAYVPAVHRWPRTRSEVAFAWHTPHAALEGPVGIEKANTITYAVRAKGKTRPRLLRPRLL